MSYIPFEIQSEIMKRLPVKSLIQFRSVSKQWMSLIDNPEFIKNYHVNHANPQHHLLVRYQLGELGTVQAYTSIIDNNTFPQQKFRLTAPESLSLLRHSYILGSAYGLLCFCGDVDSETRRVVIWNPSVRKSVGIVIPNSKAGYKRAIVGFGVCPDTSDPKLVKITVDAISSMWVVEVFTLSTRVWKTVYTGAPFKSCDFWLGQVFVDGVIYFSAFHFDRGSRLYTVISFDLKSEKFGEVCLPKRLIHVPYLDVAKVNESLALLEYHGEGEVSVCRVWTRKDGANKPFTKIYTVKFECLNLYGSVLGFRNNGEAVIKLDNFEQSSIAVYDPSSGYIHDVGINGTRHTHAYARSYMETLLLLDESDSIIY